MNIMTDEGTVFYSGDFSSFSQRTIEGIHIPKLRPDVSIVETTYGTRLHSNRQVEERRLVSLVSECVKSRQKILIPCFALGRAQEVLLILRAAIQNGDIPAVPVLWTAWVRGHQRHVHAQPHLPEKRACQKDTERERAILHKGRSSRWRQTRSVMNFSQAATR